MCQFFRKVRLVLAEKSVEHELLRELTWSRRDVFVVLNPAAQTPVMINAVNGNALIDSIAICEYFAETVEKSPLLGGSSNERAETRRRGPCLDGKSGGWGRRGPVRLSLGGCRSIKKNIIYKEQDEVAKRKN